MLKDLNCNPRLWYPLTRIMLQLLLETDVASTISKDLHGLSIFVDLLERTVNKDVDTNLPTTVDALRTIFNLTMHLGPLNGPQTPPTQQEVDAFAKFVIILQIILNFPKKSQYVQVKLDTVNCLINTPYVCTALFEPVKIIPSLLNLLSVKIDDPKVEQVATPLLLVLCSIVRDIPTARRIIKKIIFPYTIKDREISVEPPPEISQNKDSLGAKLIKLMTSLTFAFKYYVNEFIYQLCDEDANEFMKITGIGNAAGLLSMRGLFGFGQGLTKEGPQPTSTKTNHPTTTASQESEAEKQTELLKQMEHLLLEGKLTLDLDDEIPKDEKEKDKNN